ncbi:MAG TPA: flagellar biosynthesis protein FlgF, partial [Cellvibrionales bacterium]|nr:flagellar biosynthesis protein FlgF [Cellvibrionales bacterium]
MDRALYISMTGAKHNMLEQAARSHNLANVSTVGFKADLANAMSMPIKSGDGYNSRVYAVTQTPAVDLSSGPLIETGRELDVAVDGDGWIAIQTNNGDEAYTRGGNLSVDSFGLLRNERGLLVMGNSGPIAIPEAEKIEVGVDGTISVRALGQGPETLVAVDRIKLVNPDTSALQKQQDGLIY